MTVETLDALIQKNPFPGLRFFESEEAHLFFGREGQTDTMLERLNHKHFLAVVGTSGSGKSSLVRAGLMPSLYSGSMTEVGARWRLAIFRPGNNPIGNLAKALSDPEVLSIPGIEQSLYASIIQTTLNRTSLGLVDVVQQARLADNENLLIVVDQFEEIFRFKRSPNKENSADEAAAFVKLLLEAVNQKAVYVVLTMRSDFLGDCAQFRDLPEAINDGQYLIPRMTRDQRRLAIEGPIAVAGEKISPVLVDRLLNDMGDNPEQLPVLQHALMRTWDNWAHDHRLGEPIDLRHYEAIGTMENALSCHADEVYNGLANDRQKFIAEKLFKCLTERGADNRGIRRPLKLGQIGAIIDATIEEVIPVVEEFRKPGRSFLMPPVGTKLTAETMLDISHESLMRYWKKLKDWVEQEGESAKTYRYIAESAIRHQKGKGDLLQGRSLRDAMKWSHENNPNQAWADLYNPEFELTERFLQNSEKKEFNDESEERKADIEADSNIQQSFNYLPDVYISYSRKDREFTNRLVNALKQNDIKVWVDWKNIPIGSDWRAEIRTAIQQAHTLVFVISPDSISSQICRQDIKYATEFNTRILPVLWRRDFDLEEAPEELRVYNWLDMQESESFENGIKSLIYAIETDLNYVRMHARLTVMAVEWDSHKREPAFLLTGKQLQEAKSWLRQSATKTPRPTNLQRSYIETSHRKQLQHNARMFITLTIPVLALVSSLYSGFLSWETKDQQIKNYQQEIQQLEQKIQQLQNELND